ncbi:MAG TPA: hypothetical protein VMQ67_13045 [Candidatus Saccharimonadales bacterium]|nr:hypothetical protein [Candidatus Saccharimonadales bacterium]
MTCELRFSDSMKEKKTQAAAVQTVERAATLLAVSEVPRILEALAHGDPT